MSGGSPSLLKQLAAVERAAVNLGGHVQNLRDLVKKGKRPELELKIAEQWLPDLQAAARTLQILIKPHLQKKTGE